MRLLSEVCKLDGGVISADLNGASTSRYYSMGNYAKALIKVTVGAMAAGVTCIIQTMQGQDKDGTGGKVVTNNAATITANQNVTSATLTLDTVLVGDAVTINGLVFTAAAVADLPNRVFSQAGDNTADAASLVLAINHATAGAPGVVASSNAAVVTLVQAEPGVQTITIADAAATITPATLSAQGYVECLNTFLDDENGFGYVAARVTTSAATLICAEVIRGEDARYTPRYNPQQAVAASKVDVSV